MARKYSVAEIDHMRLTIRQRFPMMYCTKPGFGGSGPMVLTDEYDGQVEDQLRTYMLNGTEPHELEPPNPNSDP